MLSRRFPLDDDTQVCCPSCGGATLRLRCSCLQTRFLCPGCGESYQLEQLAQLLDEASFSTLAEAVADRLSDRV